MTDTLARKFFEADRDDASLILSPEEVKILLDIEGLDQFLLDAMWNDIMINGRPQPDEDPAAKTWANMRYRLWVTKQQDQKDFLARKPKKQDYRTPMSRDALRWAAFQVANTSRASTRD